MEFKVICASSAGIIRIRFKVTVAAIRQHLSRTSVQRPCGFSVVYGVMLLLLRKNVKRKLPVVSAAGLPITDSSRWWLANSLFIQDNGMVFP